MTILIFVYAFNRNKHTKLYLPSTFQTSDIGLLSPKIELNIHLTKSLNIHLTNHSIFTSNKFQGSMLKNNNLSYIAQNHSSVMY